MLIGGRLAADFGQRELARRLTDRGCMRVRLSHCPDTLLREVRLASPRAEWSPASSELVLPGAAAARPALLDVIRRGGVDIEALTTEEGRLDALYRDLVKGDA